VKFTESQLIQNRLPHISVEPRAQRVFNVLKMTRLSRCLGFGSFPLPSPLLREQLVCLSPAVVGKMTTFDLWPIPLGGGAWGAGTNMWHPETPASYESLPAPLATQIPTLCIHTSGGRGCGGGSDIRSMSSIRPICKCRCPPLLAGRPYWREKGVEGGKEPNNTTVRKPGPLYSINYSLPVLLPVPTPYLSRKVILIFLHLFLL
jgi:hypothetical protein